MLRAFRLQNVGPTPAGFRGGWRAVRWPSPGPALMWGRMDDKLHRNSKQLGMSDAAYRLWTLSWSYCLDTPAPTGFMSTSEALAFARTHRKSRVVIAEVVDKRGWESVDGGFLVHDLGEYLPESSAARTRAYRDRKRRGVTSPTRHRHVTSVTSQAVTGYVTVTSPRGRARARVPVPVPVPVPGPVPTDVSATPHSDQSSPLLVLEPEVSLSPIEQVFHAWLTSTERTDRTLLDEKRRRLIQAALKHYPLEDVLDAVDGWRFDAHHRGDNDRRRPYNDLELLLRDAKHIEQFRNFKRVPTTLGMPMKRTLAQVYREQAAVLREAGE